jgi:hypothetical protein
LPESPSEWSPSPPAASVGPAREVSTRRLWDAVSKVPVIVQPGTRFDLTVEPPDRGRASLSYRDATRSAKRVADGDPGVRFKACFSDIRTGWPGGFVVAGPECVRIGIQVLGHKPVRRRVQFGRQSCR